ncbi:MAG TPA: glycosyltransferase [Solirubrobacteraceae bacterium]|jgi:MGT family glycosyltransferase
MKILAYTSPARGHLYPLVPILDELAGRGHRIAIRTLASEVELMSDRGFDAAPIAPAIEAIEHDDYRARTPPAKLKRGMATFGKRSAHEVADLRAAIDTERPDAILVDCMTWGATAVAEGWGGPWAQWFPFPLAMTSRDVPPFGPGLKPADGIAGRARDRLLRPMLTGALKRACLPALNATRTSVGVRPFDTTDEMFGAAPLLLYMTAEPFEYPRSDWPASVRMVGPCSWEPPADPPTWLTEIARPLVLVTTSSEFQDDGQLVRTALDALADEDIEVVATMPATELSGDVPANARVERFIPHTPVLGRAACAVTHGGAGATQKALASGVPVCVVPFGRDQLEVARRVEIADAGTRLPAQRLSPERLRKQIRIAMTKQAGAQRVAAGYTATGGAFAAADAFEALSAARSNASRTVETGPASIRS